MTFTDEQRSVLRQLKSVCEDAQVCLIGASAIAWHIANYWRYTNDLHLAVAVSMDALFERVGELSGWRRDPQMEHRWHAPGNLNVDILPAGPEHLRAGYVEWPSGIRMSLSGFRLALERATPVQTGGDLLLDIAPLSVIVLLKMVAYQEQPTDRLRDLEDIAYLLDEYLSSDDERRFSEEVLDAEIAYEHTSAFELGRDLGSMINSDERDALHGFLRLIEDETHPLGTQARMSSSAPIGWRNKPEELLARIHALRLGLSRTSR